MSTLIASERIVVTGMSILSPLGGQLHPFFENLVAGKSAITHWKQMQTSGMASKIGGDLTDYDLNTHWQELKLKIPEFMGMRAQKIFRKLPWTAKASVILGLEAYLQAGLTSVPLDGQSLGVVSASSDVNLSYDLASLEQFKEDPDYLDPMYPVYSLDTNHAGLISEVLGAKGGSALVAGACASGNLGLKYALDEIRYHGLKAVCLLGPIYDFAPIYLQGLANLGAISTQSFNEQPHLASRPFDTAREGFVPAHAGGALILESLDSALKRGVPIWAEVLGVASTSDASHLPFPNPEGQILLLKKLFQHTGVDKEEIDFVSAHATSTPAGDVVETDVLQDFFGTHTQKLCVNAPKSLLGHPCGSAAVVELVAGILQMHHNHLHPSINVKDLDPRIQLDVVPNVSRKKEIHHFLKNSFGFGGINCSSLLKKYSGK